MLSYLLRVAQKSVLWLPRAWALAVGAALGTLSYWLFRQRRHIAEKNLHHALRHCLTSRKEKKIVKQCFRQLGLNLVEFLRFPEIHRENLSTFVTFHGLSYLEKAYAQQKGVLVLTAHIGNWELLAAAISLKGFHTGVVVKQARQKAINAFLNTQRTAKNLTLFSGKNLIRPILHHLKHGGVVGIVLDQSAIQNEGVSVPFFGRPAHTFKSLAIFALRTGAPVIPIFTYRDAKGHHHIVVEPEIITQDQGISDEKTIYTRTLHYTQWLESVIQRYPEQWIWTHRRWKIRH